jgi:acyl carrier protein
VETDQIRSDVLAVLQPFMRKLPEGFALTDSTSLVKDLDIDSADMMDLVLCLEERFSIRVKEKHIDMMKTFGDLVSIVRDLSDSVSRPRL